MLQTPLTSWHREAGARLVDFAGWEMPVQYSTIVEEHNAVRNSLGLFDISHMGRLVVRGDRANEFLNLVTSVDVNRLKPGKIRYALAMNERGGIQDDILIYHQPDEFFVVVNASNRLKVLSDWQSRVAEFSGVEILDETLSSAMIAIQGRHAVALLQERFPVASELKYYHSQKVQHNGSDFLISRTGYTGEDGFELVAANAAITSLWPELISEAKTFSGLPCGLGCRDTLRLEAGMPLYGHELSEEIDPLSAGLGFAVDMGKSEFIGREVLAKILENGLEQSRVGLELTGKRIAREHAAVVSLQGEPLGEITSGTFSPTLQKVIAIAYVKTAYAGIDTELLVDIRGTTCPAKVSRIPFFKRDYP